MRSQKKTDIIINLRMLLNEKLFQKYKENKLNQPSYN